MRACLADGGSTPSDVGYINAHGTSTAAGRRRGDRGGQGGLRRAGPQARLRLHQVDDRPPAGRGGRARVRRLAAGRHLRRRSRPRSISSPPIPSATSTARPTGRSSARWTWRCRTPSGSAATTSRLAVRRLRIVAAGCHPERSEGAHHSTGLALAASGSSGRRPRCRFRRPLPPHPQGDRMSGAIDLARLRDPLLRPIAEKVGRGERLTPRKGSRSTPPPISSASACLADSANRRQNGDRVFFSANQHINPDQRLRPAEHLRVLLLRPDAEGRRAPTPARWKRSTTKRSRRAACPPASSTSSAACTPSSG